MRRFVRVRSGRTLDTAEVLWHQLDDDPAWLEIVTEGARRVDARLPLTPAEVDRLVALLQDPPEPTEALRRALAGHGAVMCHMEHCTSTATHGPSGEAIVCWSHAGDWPRISNGSP